MQFTLFGYRFTLFHIEKLARFPVQIDRTQAQQQADEIKSNPRFEAIRQQAALIRANR